jgi:hypothetical protein
LHNIEGKKATKGSKNHSSGQFLGLTSHWPNAELNLRFRLNKLLNLEPERGVRFGSVQARTDFRTGPSQHQLITVSGGTGFPFHLVLEAEPAEAEPMFWENA